MYRLTILRLTAILAVSSAAACGADSDPTRATEVTPVATDLRIAAGEVALQVPQTTSVTATVYDQSGRAMASLAPTWTSRDSTTANVTPAGVVTAVETGDTWVVATAAGLKDSVLVRVRFPIGQGESRLRIHGPTRDRTRLMSPYGWSVDMVGTDTLDRVRLEFDGTDAYLLFVAPANLTEGEVPVQPWSMEELLAGATVFQVPAPGGVLVEVEDDRETGYVGESGYLEVTSAGTTVADGERWALTGHLLIRAVGYDLTNLDSENATASLTGDTVTIDLDFDVSILHRELGYALVHFQDGPIAGEEEMWDATVEWPNVNPPETPLITLAVEGSARLTAMILSPEPGDLSVYAQDPDGTFGFGRGRTSLRMTGYWPYFRASGQGGTLTLTNVALPEAPSAGELSGTLEASMLYWLGDNPQTAQTGTVSMEFHALWPPKEAAQPTAALSDDRSPWLPLFRPPNGRR